MGSKHNKKRFFCVKYNIKPDGRFDEFVELSKKKIGVGKMLGVHSGTGSYQQGSLEE
jgi:hypothetical protein